MVKITSVYMVATNVLGFSFGVRAQTEMKVWYIEDMYMLKVTWNEKQKIGTVIIIILCMIQFNVKMNLS